MEYIFIFLVYDVQYMSFGFYYLRFCRILWRDSHKWKRSFLKQYGDQNGITIIFIQSKYKANCGISESQLWHTVTHFRAVKLIVVIYCPNKGISNPTVPKKQQHTHYTSLLLEHHYISRFPLFRCTEMNALTKHSQTNIMASIWETNKQATRWVISQIRSK